MKLSQPTALVLGRRHAGLQLAAQAGDIAYLLRDEFTTPVAAGSVNGTLAEPGGIGTLAQRTRVVTDTNLKLSIASGALAVVTGGAATGNPGLWYGSFARVFGRVLLCAITQGSTASRATFGWDANQAGATSYSFNFEGGGLIRIPGSPNTVGDYTATTYYLAAVLRASGVFYFIRGGAFTNWTLLLATTAGSDASVFPSLIASATATPSFTADEIKIPDALYIVPVLAYDTFTRANGALGSSEIVGPDGQATQARAWTDQLGTWAVASNVAVASALSGGLAVCTYDSGVADVRHGVKVTRAAGSAGGVLRWSDSSNYLRMSHDGTNALLEQVVAGVPTTLRTAAATYSAGAELECYLEGTTGRLFYNKTVVGAAFVVPSSSATLHGLYTTDTGNTLNDVVTQSRGSTDNAYSGLSSF